MSAGENSKKPAPWIFWEREITRDLFWVGLVYSFPMGKFLDAHTAKISISGSFVSNRKHQRQNECRWKLKEASNSDSRSGGKTAWKFCYGCFAILHRAVRKLSSLWGEDLRPTERCGTNGRLSFPNKGLILLALLRFYRLFRLDRSGNRLRRCRSRIMRMGGRSVHKSRAKFLLCSVDHDFYPPFAAARRVYRFFFSGWPLCTFVSGNGTDFRSVILGQTRQGRLSASRPHSIMWPKYICRPLSIANFFVNTCVTCHCWVSNDGQIVCIGSGGG